MKIGKPQREYFIEPLELPEPIRETPEVKPEQQPQEEPVKHGV